MTSRTIPWLLGAAAFALAATARATVVLPVDVETLSRRAELVVRGTVLSTSSAWTEDRMQIHTVTRIAVGRALKGQPPAVVEIRTPGGVVGDVGQKVLGAPEFTVGEEVIVFLRRHGGSHRFGVDGFGLGKFRVAPGQDGSAVVTQSASGIDVRMPDGQILPAPAFAPVREEEFVRRVQKAVAADRAAP